MHECFPIAKRCAKVRICYLRWIAGCESKERIKCRITFDGKAENSRNPKFELIIGPVVTGLDDPPMSRPEERKQEYLYRKRLLG